MPGDVTHTASMPGCAARSFALAALCFAAIELPTRGVGAAEVLGAIAVAVAAACVLIVVERRAADPMVPLAWFGNAKFGYAKQAACSASRSPARQP